MIPKIRELNSFTIEPFEEYLSRWPSELKNFPEDVIRNWPYHHNEDFLEHWPQLNIVNWKFTLSELSNEEIMSIDHLKDEIQRMDRKGDEVFRRRERGYDTWDFMFENGTFPCPIIVAVNANEVIHPKGINGEKMKTPYQIVEGHRRLTLLRAFIRHRYDRLLKYHKVWLLSMSA